MKCAVKVSNVICIQQFQSSIQKLVKKTIFHFCFYIHSCSSAIALDNLPRLNIEAPNEFGQEFEAAAHFVTNGKWLRKHNECKADSVHLAHSMIPDLQRCLSTGDIS